MPKLPETAIFTFHGIGRPPAGIPEDEKPYWIAEEAFHALIPRLADDARALGVQLLVTFDDGNRSDLLIAAPLLKQAGVDTIFFPCSGRIGKPGYLSADDLTTLVSDGFEVGSHGVDHIRWATLHGAALHDEIAGSRAILQDALGRNVGAAALPFGSYNRRVLAALRDAGYERVYSSDPGFAAPGRWFNRRFSYHSGVEFDLSRLVAEHSRPSRKLIGAAKRIVKSLR